MKRRYGWRRRDANNALPRRRNGRRNDVSAEQRASHRLRRMLRPGSWIRPAGVSPVPVGTGAPGSRPQLVGEIWRAERGVESLFGGSKRAGRSFKRTLQPRHSHNGRAEPLISRRRPRLAGPVPGSAREVSSGYGWWHVRKVWSGTGETRLRMPCRAETGRISRW
jgi:hypothetical protein